MSSNDASSRRTLLRVAGATLSGTLAGCAGTSRSSPDGDGTAVSCSSADHPYPSDWPLAGYDSRNTAANPEATGPRESVGVEWTADGLRSVWGTPVVAGESVYVQETSTRLSAFARETGGKRWSVELTETGDSQATTSHSGPHLTPAVAGDTVYVGGGTIAVETDGPRVERTDNRVRLYAIDRHDGTTRWTVRPDHYVATAPVVVGDTVLFATLAGTLYAVDTGRERVAWRSTLDGLEAPIPTPAVADCRCYLTTVENGLYALDVSTGQRKWHLPAVGSGSPPAVADGLVFVCGRDGTVAAVDTETQSVAWRFDAGRAVSTASPAVAGGTVFVGDADGDAGDEAARIHALDATTGEEVWSARTEEYVNASPAVADGLVYVAVRDEIRALDAATGEQKWRFDASGSIRAPLSVADGTVFAGTLNGRVYALGESS
ncbi:PQQ-binding-like beta-propeller repeat protein (plasmid) [Halorussus limi]|uniref:PQQ-binding-like beta-propeller repeat protein n=1 Tax=Halorussus limi TaxID=2938695 RepID=A0A8U0I0Y3_9EURY|nr:PQQ-binding-like beta-propeller repeat protein [Halorussus limi]UPV76566.1 PQQ-binding-like beta-propeller repeat protein [Halorussus limi]